MHDRSTDTTLTCHARTPLVFDPIEERVERARECERTGAVDTVVVRSWPETVRLDDDGPDHEVVETYERFQRWADHRGVTVSPPFVTRTRSSIVEDDGVELLETPVLCLSLYHGERLVGVYPHSADGETYTVERVLRRLESGELPGALGAPLADGLLASTCPSCEGKLLNGQGLFTCPDCGWTGSRAVDDWEELEPADHRSRSEPSPR